MKRFYVWLDTKVFPKVVKFYIHPIIIALTILLFVPMTTFADKVVLILFLNGYMNVGSFSTSQVTLREVCLTADAQEKRAQETHDAVMSELAIVREEQEKINALLGDESKLMACWEDDSKREAKRDLTLMAILEELRRLDYGIPNRAGDSDEGGEGRNGTCSREGTE